MHQALSSVCRLAVVVTLLLVTGACASGREQRPSVTARDPTLAPYVSTGWHVTVFYPGSSKRYGARLTEGGDYIMGFGADGVTVARIGDSLLVETSVGSDYYYEVDARTASDRYGLPTPDQVRAVLGGLGDGDAPSVDEIASFGTLFAGGPATVTSVLARGERLEIEGPRSGDGTRFRVALLRVDEASLDQRWSRQRVEVDDANLAALLDG